MTSIFTKIINKEIPGRIIWEDSTCIAMVDIRPLNRGHVLVIPREEVDKWHELSAASISHLMTIAHKVAEAQQLIFKPARVGLMIAGFSLDSRPMIGERGRAVVLRAQSVMKG